MYRLPVWFCLSTVVFALGCGSLASPPAADANAAENSVAAPHTASIVPGRYVVVYNNGSIASVAAGTQAAQAHSGGSSANRSDDAAATGDASVIAALAAQPGVTAVLHDRLVSSYEIGVVPSPNQPAPPATGGTQPAADLYYVSPQGWAVRQAGGYGAGVLGGPSSGPWDTSMGAGVRIAILDTGLDANHPDLASNIRLNQSEVDPAALASPCDDASPTDQQGHGTWVASLAAGASGSGTGDVIGVAPRASLLNIKVLERLPAATGASLTERCNAGQGGGLLSWVLLGIQDAVSAKADVISLSLGVVLDVSTADGAGWKAAFDRATHAATASGSVVVAAAGNDGRKLSGRYLEFPAQARDVLPVIASTNAACAEDLRPRATCSPGAVTRPYYSNYGMEGAVAAPGGSYPNASETAVSGWVRGACASGKAGTASGLPSEGGSFGCFALGHAAYVQAIGTSASAPLVSGVAALLRAAHPGWTAAQTVAAIRSTASATTSMEEPQVNAAAALALP